MKASILFILLLLTTSQVSFAQDGVNEILYQKALTARQEYRYQDGLALMQIALKADSENVDYLAQTSYFMARVGQLQALEDAKMTYYHKAEYLAIKAVKLNSQNAEAHYAYALALGRINENASSKQKISNAKIMRTELDDCLKLNPEHDGAWHVLGRWHKTIAGFNAFEKFAINTLFGGVPEGGSYDAAILSFQNAIKYRPVYMLHYYELADTYYIRDNEGDKALAKDVIKQALALQNIAPDDAETRIKCELLLKKLQ